MNADVACKRPKDDVERWLHDCVLGLSLCPYARVPLNAGKVQLRVVTDEYDLIESLPAELQNLQESDTETTLLILSAGLEDFLDFNDRFGELEDWLDEVGLNEQFQLVGFHPAYLFAGAAADDPGNFANRSPYPVVQILRAASVASAIDNGGTLAIPTRNDATLRKLSSTELHALFPWA